MARYDIIMTLDADVIVEAASLQRLVAPLLRKGVAASNAIAKIHRPRSFLERFQSIEFAMNDLIRTSFSLVFANSIWFYGAVACYKKEVLEDVGGFNPEALTDDMDISLTLYRRGHRIVTVKDAVMYTLAVPTIASLFRQRMRWYFGALQSLFRHRKLLRAGRHSVPVLFLFFNQFWWTLFAFLFFPLTIIQIIHWFPQPALPGISAVYLFRWFSLWGPFYVLWKIPVWGVNFLNLFAVLSGILTFGMSLAALRTFRVSFNWKTAVCLFFYFPYTIVQDTIIIASIFWYAFSKKRQFID
ncbi:MAG: glycosyltransferase family 2 protein [DPANN group archaeon]|nr:glycosyltransferase family 2 protein [DPANN group archaeon]